MLQPIKLTVRPPLGHVVFGGEKHSVPASSVSFCGLSSAAPAPPARGPTASGANKSEAGINLFVMFMEAPQLICKRHEAAFRAAHWGRAAVAAAAAT